MTTNWKTTMKGAMTNNVTPALVQQAKTAMAPFGREAALSFDREGEATVGGQRVKDALVARGMSAKDAGREAAAFDERAQKLVQGGFGGHSLVDLDRQVYASKLRLFDEVPEEWGFVDEGAMKVKGKVVRGLFVRLNGERHVLDPLCANLVDPTTGERLVRKNTMVRVVPVRMKVRQDREGNVMESDVVLADGFTRVRDGRTVASYVLVDVASAVDVPEAAMEYQRKLFLLRDSPLVFRVERVRSARGEKMAAVVARGGEHVLRTWMDAGVLHTTAAGKRFFWLDRSERKGYDQAVDAAECAQPGEVFVGVRMASLVLPKEGGRLQEPMVMESVYLDFGSREEAQRLLALPEEEHAARIQAFCERMAARECERFTSVLKEHKLEFEMAPRVPSRSNSPAVAQPAPIVEVPLDAVLTKAEEDGYARLLREGRISFGSVL